jgi:hypothetical protein
MEDAEGTIAKKLEDFSAVFFMEGQQDTPMAGTKKKSPLFVDVHQMSVSYDVGENDCCELALKLSFHVGR